MSGFPAIVVEHATLWPGIDAMAAAELARGLFDLQGEAKTVGCVRLRPPRDFTDTAAREYVAPYGALVANGFFWIERSTGRPMGPGFDLAPGAPELANAPKIISVNPSLFWPGRADAMGEAIAGCAAERARVRVVDGDAGLECHLVEHDRLWLRVGKIERDRYGRPRSIFAREALTDLATRLGLSAPARNATADPARVSAPHAHGSPRVVLVGEPMHFHSVYPPVLAAIADAADELHLDPTVDILPARAVPTPEGRARIGAAHGLVLPGGCDMSQTEGQIAAARQALDADLPALGLCLGMQTMAVAVARHRAGLAAADLEEVNPRAPYLLFRRLHGSRGEPVHRLGTCDSLVLPGTLLAAILSCAVISERMNHRYHLDPRWLPELETAGLRVAATSTDGRVVDAIEHAGQTFFLGLQGHPEMSSRAGCPHAAVRAFLAAAQRAADR